MQDVFAHCEALVRADDRDRFLSTLFAPAEQRGALYALYAFNLEVARVRDRIREPLAGEIRLQWWVDALAGQQGSDFASHPVACALATTIERYELPSDLLTGLIDLHRFDLYDDPMPTLADLEDYGERTASAVIELAARVLDHETPNIASIARPAGLADAIAGLLKMFPLHAARGQLYLPLELLSRHGARREDFGERAPAEWRAMFAELRALARTQLAEAGKHFENVPTAMLPALLPVATVRPLLDRMERRDYEPFQPLEVPPWRRQWWLWRAARRPRRIFA